ncbi:hypothetical protein M4D51_08005 [Microbacterium sp. p3-SID338]|uniref:hypothetical protein n=1 Tax=Microbacterium sp. p3-SID338 TaxID=2916214 RepID=UPI0021A84C32|nr:hypothetical protein [Microbacterium sp. p3-SID338]MCT1395668.1 hypothetical protein [Microbacterium sp. p3-SID338]
MVMRVYATEADYNAVAEDAWDGDAGMLTKRLRAASIEVEKLTRLSRYDTDDDGFPTDTDVADAFAEATCAIVEHWQDTGDPRGTDAAQGAVKILSVSLGTTSSNNDARSEYDKLVARIGDRAIDVLKNAGLISAVVAHR